VITSCLSSRLAGVPRIIIACSMLLSLAPAIPPDCNAFDAPPAAGDRVTAATRGDLSYENATLTEDVTWRGTVLVRGSLVIAAQATLRIEPGTVVRFAKRAGTRQAPRLVVMGRLSCNGTADRPVLLAPDSSEPGSGEWGGVLLLSSEKRNQVENCRIEGAETAIEARFSTLTAKGVTVLRSVTGLLLRDSTATLSTVAVSGCATGLESHDSELDLRDGTLADNRQGVSAHRSTLVLAALNVSGSEKEGILAEECRLKFNSCELADNGVGALLKGGEGQLLMSRFVRNRDAGLQLSGARIKVYRCLFADNRGDGMRVDDGRGIVWASAFSGNGGYNLANAGSEAFSAVQNWWGGADEATIAAKLLDSAKDARLGAVAVAPWLTERPAVLP
jgi:hypothetical protein